MIKKYNDFCNEEMNIKKMAAAGLLAASLSTSCVDKITTQSVDTETVDSVNFKEYIVETPEWYIPTLYFNISPNNIIGTKWTTRSGKSSITHYTITVPDGIKELHYNTSTWGTEIYADTNMKNNNIIKIDELEIIKETSTYKVLEMPGMFTTIDYIFVNKNYTNKQNSFTTSVGKFTYYKYSNLFLDQYFVVPQ